MPYLVSDQFANVLLTNYPAESSQHDRIGGTTWLTPQPRGESDRVDPYATLSARARQLTP